MGIAPDLGCFASWHIDLRAHDQLGQILVHTPELLEHRANLLSQQKALRKAQIEQAKLLHRAKQVNSRSAYYLETLEASISFCLR